MSPFPIAFLLFLSMLLPVFGDEVAKSPDPTASQAQWEEAIRLLDGNKRPDDPRRAFEILKPLADAGYPAAENTLGWMYDVGTGVESDPKLAFELYKKAALAGEPSAASNLGDVYSIGRLGQAVDKPLSRKWYAEGAEKGNAHAALCLAWDCLHGIGGPVDRAKARVVLYTATNVNESKQAQYTLALLYATEGEGVPQNKILALFWCLVCGDGNKGGPVLEAALRSQMSPEEIARATAKATEYRDILKAGGFVIAPEHLDERAVDYAAHPEWKAVSIRRGTSILIPLTVNGQGPFDFVLDTGCSASLIDDGLARKLGLEETDGTRVMGVGQKVAVADAAFFGNTLRKTVFAEMPLDGMSGVVWHRISGILGYDVLSRFVVEIDYGAKKVRFSDPGTFAYAGTGEALPLTFENGTPYVVGKAKTLAADPIAEPMLLDTGSGGSLDGYAGFSRRFDFTTLVPKTIRCLSARMLNGDFYGMMGRFQSFALGSFTIPSPEVSVLPQQESNADGDGLAIGGEILNRFTLIVDYRRQRIILEPSGRIAESSPTYYTGVAIEGMGEGYHILRVIHIDTGSPAEKSGLKVGDEVVGIDGFQGEALWDGCPSAKKETTFVVKREGQTMTLTVGGEEY